MNSILSQSAVRAAPSPKVFESLPGRPAGLAPAPRDRRRGSVRPVQPRALCDRRVDVPDDALRGGRAGRFRGRGDDPRVRAPGGDPCPAPGRRHVPVRADRQPRHRHRPYPSHARVDRIRRRIANLHRPAGNRAGRTQPSPQAARPVVPGGRVHRFAGHHRRHDREQLLRQPLDPLRPDARQRDRRRRADDERRARHFRSGGFNGPAPSARRPGLLPALPRRARARGNRRTLSRGDAATTSTR